ncbi:MAG: hypothetical protein ACTSRZ_09240 [Promethearchaeota archaeon]
MSAYIRSGTKILLKPMEESVPYNDWLSWLKNFAISCVKKIHLPIKVGKIHTADDY